MCLTEVFPIFFVFIFDLQKLKNVWLQQKPVNHVYNSNLLNTTALRAELLSKSK